MKATAKQLLALSLLGLLLPGCGKKDSKAARSIECRDINYALNTVDPDLAIMMPPNAISPNGDGINERFVLLAWTKSTGQPVTFQRVSLKVKKQNSPAVVFEGQDYRNDFAGRDNQGNELPEGTYTYEATLDANTVTGSFVLVRTSKTCNCRTIDIDDEYLNNVCR